MPLMDYLKELFPQILFFMEQTSLFSITDLLNYLNIKPSKQNKEFISLMISEHCFAYPQPFPETAEKLWISRQSFFTKKEFAVTPTDFELQEKIFIPGSRLAPFINPFVIPCNPNISYKKEPAGKIIKELNISSIKDIYFLCGEDSLPAVLLEDCKENMEKFGQAYNSEDFIEEYGFENYFYVTAFNFKYIYSELNIKSGDKIIFKIENWSTGNFSVTKKAPEKEDGNVRKQWFREFENGVKESLKLLPINAFTEDIIAFAFFIKEKELFDGSFIAMDAYFKNANIFSVKKYGLEEKFWITDEEIPQYDFWIPFINDDITETPVFFLKTELPISEQIIESMIFVFMENNYINYRKDSYKDKCIKELCTLFLPSSPGIFDSLYKECYEIIKKRYTFYIKKYNPFENSQIIDLRGITVSFFKEVFSLIKDLKYSQKKPKDFKNYSGLILNQLILKLNNIFNFLFYYKETDAVYIENLCLSLEDMHNIFKETKANIQNTLSGKGRLKF